MRERERERVEKVSRQNFDLETRENSARFPIIGKRVFYTFAARKPCPSGQG